MTDWDRQFDDTPIPPADEQAKRAAIEAATARYRQRLEKTDNRSQGLGLRLRLMVESLRQRSTPMATLTKRPLLAGLASACATVLVLFIALPAILTPDPVGSLDDLQEPKPQKIPESMAERSRRLAPERKIETVYMDMAAPVPEKPSLAARSQMQEVVVADSAQPQSAGDWFEAVDTNGVQLVAEQPVSTFSADVDTVSYSYVRRQLNQGEWPRADAVRPEEMINYFDYDYPVPASREAPFTPTVNVMDSPWADGRQLVHIGIKGYELPAQSAQKTNLVFLLDVSGSMGQPDKLPLVKKSMKLLLGTLNPDDTVAIAVYAGSAGTVLEPTAVQDKQAITRALDRLSAGGSTAGGEGIELAYSLAQQNFDEDAINRVILATDGDFNVGISNPDALKTFIEQKRESGIFLSVLGFGQGNYQDHRMQSLAQNGNGVAAYIDTLKEAQKVLVHQATASLFPIAKDVKLQVEFNPATVAEYRLIGYETRALDREDFNNDRVDAGDIGAGHTVTAIYEIVPTGSDARWTDPKRYSDAKPPAGNGGDEYGYLKLRYKQPDGDTSKLISAPIPAANTQPNKALAQEVDFSVAVAAFAQYLRDGDYLGGYNLQQIAKLADANKDSDPYGYRSEFVQLVRQAQLVEGLK